METEREIGREERPDQVLETRWETRGGLGGEEEGGGARKRVYVSVLGGEGKQRDNGSDRRPEGEMRGRREREG